MSNDNASRYLKKLLSEGTSPTSVDADTFVQRAAKDGFTFTADEWAAAVRTHAENEAGGAPLTDEDLASVSGGAGSGAGAPSTGFATCPSTSGRGPSTGFATCPST